MGITNTIPSALNWAMIQGNTTDFISTGVVIGGVGFILALVLAPKVIRSLRSMVR